MNMKWVVGLLMVLTAGVGWGQVPIGRPEAPQEEMSGEGIGEDGPDGSEADVGYEDPVDGGDWGGDPADLDGDGIPDDSDPDADGNGIADEEEFGESDPGGSDLDEDGIPDEDDPDVDGDEIEDLVDPDDDGDEIPDVVDPDVGGGEFDRVIVWYDDDGAGQKGSVLAVEGLLHHTNVVWVEPDGNKDLGDYDTYTEVQGWISENHVPGVLALARLNKGGGQRGNHGRHQRPGRG